MEGSGPAKVGEDHPKPPITAGEAAKGTQNGTYPIGTVQAILEIAPSDILEEVLPIPEWKLSVKVKSFTSSQAARIKDKMYVQKGENVKVAWTPMEIEKFRTGVIQPEFTEDDARRLHQISGRGFQRVLDWLDEHSGIREEDVRQAQDEFPEGD